MSVLQYVFSYSEHLDEIFLLGIEPLRRGVCCMCSCGIGQALPEDKIQYSQYFIHEHSLR